MWTLRIQGRCIAYPKVASKVLILNKQAILKMILGSSGEKNET